MAETLPGTFARFFVKNVTHSGKTATKITIEIRITINALAVVRRKLFVATAKAVFAQNAIKLANGTLKNNGKTLYTMTV